MQLGAHLTHFLRNRRHIVCEHAGLVSLLFQVFLDAFEFSDHALFHVVGLFGWGCYGCIRGIAICGQRGRQGRRYSRTANPKRFRGFPMVHDASMPRRRSIPIQLVDGLTERIELRKGVSKTPQQPPLLMVNLHGDGLVGAIGKVGDQEANFLHTHSVSTIIMSYVDAALVRMLLLVVLEQVQKLFGLWFAPRFRHALSVSLQRVLTLSIVGT